MKFQKNLPLIMSVVLGVTCAGVPAVPVYAYGDLIQESVVSEDSLYPDENELAENLIETEAPSSSVEESELIEETPETPSDQDKTIFSDEDYCPTPLSQGFRIDKIEAGSYAVTITYTYKRPRYRSDIYYSSPQVLFNEAQYYGKDTMALEKGTEYMYGSRSGGPLNCFLVKPVSVFPNTVNPDGTITRTVQFTAPSGRLLTPGSRYNWRLVSQVTNKDRETRRYSHYLYYSILKDVQTFTTGEGVEESKVSIIGSPEIVGKAGATGAEICFKVDNPQNEDLISVFFDYTSKDGYTGRSSALRISPDSDIYRGVISSGKKAVEVTGKVYTGQGKTVNDITKIEKQSSPINVTPYNLDAEDVSYKLSAQTDDEGNMKVKAYMEVNSVMPCDADNLELKIKDNDFKPEKDEDGNIIDDGTTTYYFKIVESKESQTGYKAISDNNGDLDIYGKTSAKISMTLNNGSVMEKEIVSGDESITNYDTDTKLWSKTDTVGICVPVEKIGFSEKEITLPVGTAVTINPVVEPSNATDKSLEWFSTAPEVAIVSNEGVLNAKSAGIAIITAQAKDGSGITSSDEIKVTVIAEDTKEEEKEPEIEDEDKDDDNLDEDNIWVTSIDDSNFFYTGKAIKPVVRVYDGNRLLTEKTDYTLTYKNAVKVYNIKEDETGFDPKLAPAVTVSLKGDYAGSKTVYFRIFEAKEPPKSITGAVINWGSTGNIFSYAGNTVKPKPEVLLDGVKLTEGTDYLLAYKNNTKIGKASITVNGIGRYFGASNDSFTITGRSMKDPELHVTGADGSTDIYAVYAAGGAKPHIRVTYGSGDDASILKEGVDYTVKFSNNKAVTTSSTKKAPQIILTGIGYYKDKLPVPFRILKKDFSTVKVTALDVAENKSPNKFQTKVVVTDTDGTVLKIGKDYDKTVKCYEYDATTGTRGNRLSRLSKPQAGDTIRVEITGMGNYSDSLAIGYYRVLSAGNDISKAKIKIADQEFAGKGQAVTITDSSAFTTFTLNGQSLKMVEDETENGFMIVPGSYINNTKKGTAKVTVRGTGIYGGIKVVPFKITVKPVK